MVSVKYLEELPPSCPPPDAIDQPLEGAYRIVPTKNPLPKHFSSHAALDDRDKPPTVDDCLWASCSLFMSRERAIEIATLPKTRYVTPHLAKMNIVAGSGRSMLNKKSKHVNFWAYARFDPCGCVVGETEAV